MDDVIIDVITNIIITFYKLDNFLLDLPPVFWYNLCIVEIRVEKTAKED